MKDNKYEIGDEIPEGYKAGDLVDVELERKKLGITQVNKAQAKSRKQLESELDDALSRIKKLESK